MVWSPGAYKLEAVMCMHVWGLQHALFHQYSKIQQHPAVERVKTPQIICSPKCVVIAGHSTKIIPGVFDLTTTFFMSLQNSIKLIIHNYDNCFQLMRSQGSCRPVPK